MRLMLLCAGFVLSGCTAQNTVFHQPHYYQTNVSIEMQSGQVYQVKDLRPKMHELNNKGFALQYPKTSYFE